MGVKRHSCDSIGGINLILLQKILINMKILYHHKKYKHYLNKHGYCSDITLSHLSKLWVLTVTEQVLLRGEGK